MAPHADADVVVVVGTSDTTSVVVPDPVTTKNPTYTKFTIDDVLPHRAKSAPMPTTVAPFGSAKMFKSKGCFKKPIAKDFSHHISRESASRQPSSLKNVMKHIRPGMISLCGGLPSSDYFPFETVSARVPQPPSFSEQDTLSSGVDVSTRKHDIRDGTSLLDLSVCMNYGQSMGPPQLVRFVTEHTEIVHDPKYSDWEILITTGNTAALEMALRMLCKPGDSVITDEYTFSSAVETMLPMGLRPVGIAMDEHGMRADALDDVLSNWDETAHGGPKPSVVYLIPTGQNPSGATQPLERRKAIYATAEKHDLIMMEDEPYYFLQMDPYVSGTVREVASPFQPTDLAEFLDALIPSYLSLDTTGRVIRMDSMSKVLAPGTRFGWVTASPQFCQRLLRHQEVSYQNVSGFTSAILFKLLDETWGHKGFLEWLMFIRAEYTQRRDIIINACEKHLPAEVARWAVPTAGMFHWITVDGTKHPGVKSGKVKIAEVEDKVFMTAIEANVLVAKGSWFLAEKENKVVIGPGAVQTQFKTEKKNALNNLNFRMTFAAASQEQIVEAVKRFGDALRTEFGINA